MPKNNVTTQGYFIKRLRDNGFLTSRVYDRYSKDDRRKWTVVVNPDFIIGPWDIKPTSGQLILAMARRFVPFYPLGGKCFLGAKDCADAHIAAAEIGSAGQRYLLGHENWRRISLSCYEIYR